MIYRVAFPVFAKNNNNQTKKKEQQNKPTKIGLSGLKISILINFEWSYLLTASYFAHSDCRFWKRWL